MQGLPYEVRGPIKIVIIAVLCKICSVLCVQPGVAGRNWEQLVQLAWPTLPLWMSIISSLLGGKMIILDVYLSILIIFFGGGGNFKLKICGVWAYVFCSSRWVLHVSPEADISWFTYRLGRLKPRVSTSRWPPLKVHNIFDTVIDFSKIWCHNAL